MKKIYLTIFCLSIQLIAQEFRVLTINSIFSDTIKKMYKDNLLDFI